MLDETFPAERLQLWDRQREVSEAGSARQLTVTATHGGVVAGRLLAYPVQVPLAERERAEFPVDDAEQLLRYAEPDLHVRPTKRADLGGTDRGSRRKSLGMRE